MGKKKCADNCILVNYFFVAKVKTKLAYCVLTVHWPSDSEMVKMQYNWEVERGGGGVPLPPPTSRHIKYPRLGFKVVLLYIYTYSIDGNMNWFHRRGRQKHKPTLKLYICTHSKDGEILAFGFHSLSQKQIKCIGSKGQRRAQTAWGDWKPKDDVYYVLVNWLKKIVCYERRNHCMKNVHLQYITYCVLPEKKGRE